MPSMQTMDPSGALLNAQHTRLVKATTSLHTQVTLHVLYSGVQLLLQRAEQYRL